MPGDGYIAAQDIPQAQAKVFAFDWLARRAPNADEFEGESDRSEEHTSELQSQSNLVCRLLLEKKKIAVDAKPAATAHVKLFIGNDNYALRQLLADEAIRRLPALATAKGSVLNRAARLPGRRPL